MNYEAHQWLTRIPLKRWTISHVSHIISYGFLFRFPYLMIMLFVHKFLIFANLIFLMNDICIGECYMGSYQVKKLGECIDKFIINVWST